jgi:hypothetical protein
MKRFLLSGLLGAALMAGPALAVDVVVHVRPPARPLEKRSPMPGPAYVWVGGYHRWDGNAYVWVPGEWERPPHQGAVWVAPRWEHRNGGYGFVPGRWR